MIKSLNTPLEKLDSSGDVRKGVDVKFDFPVSTVAMYRNYTFVGREASLEEMDMFLLPKPQNTNQGVSDTPLSSGEPRVCILHGIGGVRNTQTALEYYHANRSDYDATF
jgi:hypothetical protein